MTNVRNVVAGKPKPGGAIFRAILGTALPTDEKTALAVAFKEQGYAEAKGLQRAIKKAYKSIAAWGGDEVKKSRTEHSVTLDFSLIEAANGEVAKSIWGESAVTITPATESAGTKIALAYAGDDAAAAVWVFDLADGGHIRRIVCPNAQPTTESFEQTFGDEDVIAYPVTLTLYKDSAGKFFYEYSDDGIKTA